MLTGGTFYICAGCGRSFPISHAIDPGLRTGQPLATPYCSACYMWDRTRQHRPRGFEVADGAGFVTIPLPMGEKMGTPCQFGYHRDGTLLRFSYVRLLGKVPPFMRDQFPDTLKVFPEGSFRPKNGRANPCRSKGCLDRHHCLWYDRSLEAQDEYNCVPDGYETGSENCPSFFDIDNFDMQWIQPQR